ncbi:MAG: type II toxin-antitoxin system HigB family toxin [Phormidium sp.]
MYSNPRFFVRMLRPSKGKKCLTFVDYEYQIVFIRNVLTHAEYDKENWKNDEWFENT